MLQCFNREMDKDGSPLLPMIDALVDLPLPPAQWASVVDMVLMPLKLLGLVHRGVMQMRGCIGCAHRGFSDAWETFVRR